MSSIDLDVHKIAKIFRELNKENIEAVCKKHSLNKYQLRDVIEAHLNINNLYTNSRLAVYLGISAATVNYWFDDNTFPKEELVLKDKCFKAVNITKFWDWMFKNRKHYNYSKIRIEAIEKAGKKIDTLYKRSLKSKNRNGLWTKYEEELLEDLWGIAPMKELCKTLGRTENAILNKARELHLPNVIDSIGDFTCMKLFGILGYSRSVIKDWEEKYNFPIIRRRSPNASRIIRFINVEKFWEWAENHKEIVDLTRCQLEDLLPVPRWAYSEKIKQMKEKERNTHFRRKWTKQDVMKLIYLKEVEGIGFTEIAKLLDRKDYIAKDKFKKLSTQENYEELLNEAKAQDYTEFASKALKRAPEFSQDQIMRLLHLSTLPKFSWEYAGYILGVPRATVHRRYKKLKENPNFEKLLNKAASTIYEEYVGIFEKCESELRGKRLKKYWCKEDLERMLYLLEVEKLSKVEVARILDRSPNSIDYQYRTMKKEPDFERMIKKVSEPKNRFLKIGGKANLI